MKRPIFLLGMFLVVVSVICYTGAYQKSESGCSEDLLLGSTENSFIGKQTKTGVESPDLTFVENNSLAGISCSQIVDSKVLGAVTEEDSFGGSKEITEYTVQQGDSLIKIADDFGISLNTLLWANDLNKNSVISPGQKLIVLPVSGTIHHVAKGDTLSEIAENYQVKTEEIISFNELPEEEIFIGDILIVPGGEKPTRSVVSSVSVSQSSIPVASSYFIVPISSPYKITQGLHWYNAIDFANIGGSCGKPIFAAAGGEVLKIEYGYNMGAGTYIRVLHPNGLITHYGHLQKVLVSVGEKVSQGEIIGLMGYTGRTIPVGPSGCHLHFGVYSSQGTPPTNPFAY